MFAVAWIERCLWIVWRVVFVGCWLGCGTGCGWLWFLVLLLAVFCVCGGVVFAGGLCLLMLCCSCGFDSVDCCCFCLLWWFSFVLVGLVMFCVCRLGVDFVG